MTTIRSTIHDHIQCKQPLDSGSTDHRSPLARSTANLNADDRANGLCPVPRPRLAFLSFLIFPLRPTRTLPVLITPSYDSSRSNGSSYLAPLSSSRTASLDSAFLSQSELIPIHTTNALDTRPSHRLHRPRPKLQLLQALLLLVYPPFSLSLSSLCVPSPRPRLSHAPTFAPSKDGRPSVCSPSARLSILPHGRQQPRYPLLRSYPLRFSPPRSGRPDWVPIPIPGPTLWLGLCSGGNSDRLCPSGSGSPSVGSTIPLDEV